MRVQITGIGSSEYTDKNTGVLKKNKTLYFTVLDNEPNVDGLVTGSEYIGGNSPFINIPFKVGSVYFISKNTRTKFDGTVYGYIESIFDENMKPLNK